MTDESVAVVQCRFCRWRFVVTPQILTRWVKGISATGIEGFVAGSVAELMRHAQVLARRHYWQRHAMGSGGTGPNQPIRVTGAGKASRTKRNPQRTPNRRAQRLRPK